MKSNPLRFIFLSIAAALMGSREEWRGFPNNPHQKLVFFSSLVKVYRIKAYHTSYGLTLYEKR